jgi:predicted Zn-dependent protease
MTAEAPAREEILELARRIVRASPADETEVTVDALSERFVRFAKDGPTQSADRARLDVAVRARVREPGGGWREARVTTGSREPSDTSRALARALELARASPPNAELLELGGPVEVRATHAVRATLEHGFDAKAQWIDAALRECARHGLGGSGLAQTAGMSRALVNSAGREVSGAVSRATFAVTCTGADGAGFAQSSAADVAQVDAAGAVRRALSKARDSKRPAMVEPGEYAVVLEPHAVSALLLFASYQGFGAREFVERSSFLTDRVGEQAFSQHVTIADDAANELLPGFAFDGEGSPRSTVVLVERGRLGPPVTDRTWARKLGRATTGHALPQPSSMGPMPQNLVVAPGAASLDELVAGVERGLYVSQFHYVNAIDPRELVLTGMTRNGTFLIERGRIRGAVRNLRFTDSLLRALAGVTAVGRESEVAGALFEGEVVAPPLCIERFRFTSGTDF